MKIVILKRDKIGDVLLSTPMIYHLRKSLPDAEIHFYANDYNAWVAYTNRNIDRVWVYKRIRTGKTFSIWRVLEQMVQILKLRRERFDVAIVAGGEESRRGIKRALHIHAKRTIAYCFTEDLAAHLTDPLLPPQNTHEVDGVMGLLIPLNIALPSELIYPEYAPTEEYRSWANQWLCEQSLESGKFVVLGLGARKAKRQPNKDQVLRWSKWIKESYGLDTVFMWTPGSNDNPLYPGDDDIAEPVLNEGLPFIRPFRGGIQPAIALIWQARTSLFPDSGLMHFAAASPGGVLGFFASSGPSPERWRPIGKASYYIRAMKKVEGIPDEQVYEKLEKLLAP